MAQQKRRGSIVYEILIVLLILGLIATILYPKSVWERAEKERDICRQRMLDIQKAELKYFDTHTAYTDSLPQLIETLKSDTSLAVVLDTLLVSPLDSLYTCPTTQDTYKVAIIDTSVIKVLKIMCPITEEDIQKRKRNIWFSFFGGGRIENHGYIEGGEASWEEKKK